MNAILLMIIPFVGYIIAYYTYGKFLGEKIFALNQDAAVPSKKLEDGVDFVPTKKAIIFGHHYTSIAGTGPIVGPAIGIIWGWVPAILWVFLGSIFMGAVHDLGSLILSMRNQGKSISECTAKYIGTRARYIFFLFVFFALLIVIAVFGLVIAAIFSIFPGAVFAVWMQIPIALGLGWVIYKRKSNLTLFTALAVLAMYLTIIAGHYLKFTMPGFLGIPATGIWIIILLIYVFIASSLPVTTLLQPRDYINAWQLFIAMGMLCAGVLSSGFKENLHIVAPAFNLNPPGAPPLWPFLFTTIVCGAISGFHCLVSSGTSSKQVAKETDALFVGYGSMLLEAVLATLVILAVAGGIGMAYTLDDGTVLQGTAAWKQHYGSWTASAGLGSKIKAVVIGSANMMAGIGIPKSIGIIIIGVFIASFAGTTLDTATRIQRYIVTEIFSNIKLKSMTNRYTATAFAVISAAAVAFVSGADGKGALTLWPLFGAVNQMLAALSLLLLTVYLKKRGGYKYLTTAIPCIMMLSVTLSTVVINEINFLNKARSLLVIINSIIIILAIWMVVEGFIIFGKTKN